MRFTRWQVFVLSVNASAFTLCAKSGDTFWATVSAVTFLLLLLKGGEDLIR